MRIDFDFLDLEAFLAVKETGSFHLASQRLNLSQSSVTRRVQKLETALATVLFDRTTRAVRPTLAAKRLQLRAEAILQDAQEATRAMRDESAAFAYQRAQTVTFATVPTLVTSLIAPAIKAFRQAGHTARIQVLDATANDVAEAVAAGEADFGICSIPMLEASTGFEPLFNEPMVLAVPPGHRLAALSGATWADLLGEDVILPARGTGNRLLIDEALASTGRDVGWTYEVRRTTSALELVSAGIGVSPLPASVVGASQTTIHALPIREPTIARPIGLLTRIGQAETIAASTLKDEIRAQCRDLPWDLGSGART